MGQSLDKVKADGPRKTEVEDVRARVNKLDDDLDRLGSASPDNWWDVSKGRVTEYVDRFDVPGGDSLLVVSTEIVDPTYLAQPYWTSSHFKKQSDTSGWSPTPCAAR